MPLTLIFVTTEIGFGDFLTNYTFRTITFGTMLIGVCSGAVGCLLYLRKQSLISDVIGHSAIPGVMVAFAIAAGVFGFEGRSMLTLAVGAFISALAAVLLSQWISDHTRLGQDAAMAICLALFYGLGITGLHLITHSTIPGRGGIKDYMFGNATTISENDVYTIALISLSIGISFVVLWKRYKLSIFDPTIAITYGWKSSVTVALISVSATISIVMGMKAVGLILMVAFSIMPAASARQWTRTLSQMVILAAAIGGLSALVGTYISIRVGNLPTGPVIVVVLFCGFIFSLLASPQRSLLVRRRRRRIHQSRQKLDRPKPVHNSNSDHFNRIECSA